MYNDQYPTPLTRQRGSSVIIFNFMLAYAIPLDGIYVLSLKINYLGKVYIFILSKLRATYHYKLSPLGIFIDGFRL